MKKGLLLLILGVTVGFFLHALVFPDVFSNGIFILPEAAVVTPGAARPAPQATNMETIITYDGEHFSRINVTMESSRYIIIRNESKTAMMTLSSTVPELNTPRPFSYKEQVRTRLDKPGQYIIADSANPQERLVITVK